MSEGDVVHLKSDRNKSYLMTVSNELVTNKDYVEVCFFDGAGMIQIKNLKRATLKEYA